MNFLYFAPLFIVALLALMGLHLKPPRRSRWMWTVLPALLCGLLDVLLLTLLPVLQLSFGPIGLPLLLILGARLVVIVAALFLLQRRPLKRHAAALILAVGLLQATLFAGVVDGFYIEPFRLGVTEFPVHAPAFLPDRPLRILQISDLHVERITQREGDVLALAKSLQPDFIVLTGDYVNSSYMNDPRTLQETRQVLSQLNAPYGVYAVNGNVDDPPVMSAVFDELANIRVLNDEVLPLPLPAGTLYLVGVTISGDRTRDASVLKTLIASFPPEAYIILLYHTPDLITTAPATGVDLYFAGHTHGGQVRLPFYGAIFIDATNRKKHEMGEYTAGSTTLYVSRGVGMGGGLLPRVRFLCPPELVLVELGNINPP
jgi:predicted MPP superfamily phosphohydrolase